LLFMFAVQYKVHRISAYDKKQYLTTLSTCWLYDEGHKEVLQLNPPIPDIHGNVLGASSVRNLSFIPEKNLFSFMRIVGAGEETILKAIELVKIRSSYAHANGNIEENIEERIDDYLMVLQEFQSRMCPINDVLASKWKGEIEPEEKKESFVDTRLVSEFLCEADFNNGKLKKYFPRT